MDTAVNDRASFLTEMKDNQRIVRKMVMDSYQDMLAGKGRGCKDFFDELESTTNCIKTIEWLQTDNRGSGLYARAT